MRTALLPLLLLHATDGLQVMTRAGQVQMPCAASSRCGRITMDEVEATASLVAQAQTLLGEWAYEFTHDGPFEIMYSEQEYYNPDSNAFSRPITGFRLTVSGYVGLAFSLSQTLFAPWGLVEYTKRGGLGAEEGQAGGILLPGSYLRNALRRALVPPEVQAAINAEEDEIDRRRRLGADEGGVAPAASNVEQEADAEDEDEKPAGDEESTK